MTKQNDIKQNDIKQNEIKQNEIKQNDNGWCDYKDKALGTNDT